MHKNIKITEKQYRMLMNLNEEIFSYGSDSVERPYTGHKEITADGSIESDIPVKKQKTDDIEKEISKQGWNRFSIFGSRANPHPLGLGEGVEINVNKEDNTADDFGEVDAIDSPELENPNLVQIPQTVQQREERFLETTKNLNQKQKAVVLNSIIPELTSDKDTFHQDKRLNKAIGQMKGVSNTLIKNTQNNA